ncbi:MAG: FAD-dependent oxidoreductase [Mogibacterium sp.]|nr:FAD-dependent oxidoreductase [Mogibacterium sp.]
MSEIKWPYANEFWQEEEAECDVLVLGAGMAGCFAAIAAARRGQKVIVVEKGATVRSGAAGTGFDHWESACTNPSSRVTAKEIAEAYVDEQDHLSNGIAHYICCEEGWDRLVDLEEMGCKIRDTDDEFKGADFRDDETKLLFAYDYYSRFTLRVWGKGFKPALLKEMKKLGVKIYDHTEATALLTTEVEGKKRGVGAIGMDTHTGKIRIFHSKATILTMSRPARLWLFNADLPGLCEFRPFNSIGSGHSMGWRAGMEFTMMEKSVRAEFSAAGSSFPPYSAGNNHNTWYACTMVDSRGVEIPYLDRDGNVLKTVRERYFPVKGQKFFLKGGVIDEPKYEYRGPETMPFDELMKRGYKLPFYADMSRMPELERKAMWGLMIGNEGKTAIPVYDYYNKRGFDPSKKAMQVYGTGWTSASFSADERQLFGAPGGIMHDWDLKTNIDGIYAGGDQLFGSDCAGQASATGYYAGRKASAYADTVALEAYDRKQVDDEIERLYAPMYVDEGYSWKELNWAIAKCMKNYCGAIKNEALLVQGLDLLHKYRAEVVPNLSCHNTHELVRTHEVLDILNVAEMILEACRMRKSSSKTLCFERSDYPEVDPPEDHHFITIRQENGKAVRGDIELDYFGDLKTEYEKRNQDYINGGKK